MVVISDADFFLVWLSFDIFYLWLVPQGFCVHVKSFAGKPKRVYYILTLPFSCQLSLESLCWRCSQNPTESGLESEKISCIFEDELQHQSFALMLVWKGHDLKKKTLPDDFFRFKSVYAGFWKRIQMQYQIPWCTTGILRFSRFSDTEKSGGTFPMALASMTAADWESSLDFSTREVFQIGLPYNLT